MPEVHSGDEGEDAGNDADDQRQTHTITGAIIGVGSVKPMSAVRWGVARQIVWAWVLTIPASALIAALMYFAVRQLGAD